LRIDPDHHRGIGRADHFLLALWHAVPRSTRRKTTCEASRRTAGCRSAVSSWSSADAQRDPRRAERFVGDGAWNSGAERCRQDGLRRSSPDRSTDYCLPFFRYVTSFGASGSFGASTRRAASGARCRSAARHFTRMASRPATLGAAVSHAISGTPVNRARAAGSAHVDWPRFAHGEDHRRAARSGTGDGDVRPCSTGPNSEIHLRRRGS